MSAKNQLQEIYQKKGVESPIYETTRVGGEAHTPEFRSTVTLHDDHKFESDIFSKKKDAEKNAAAKALLYVQGIVEKEEKAERKEFILREDVDIFLDMENKPLIGEKIDKYIFSSGEGEIKLQFFASSGHPTLRRIYERAEVIETPTAHKDGADVHIACALARLDDNRAYNQIVITGDHFGYALVDIMKNYYHYNTYCASSFEEVCSILRELEMCD